MDITFFKDKRVLVTGHTGFKGVWMCEELLLAGAQVTGYALKPTAEAPFFERLSLADRMDSVIGDIRDLECLLEVFRKKKPEIVIHMAAQPIVRESYENPAYTYEVNVMGTVNVLECIRLTDSVKSFVNVTTDKVYKNREWEWGYRENEELNGYDPYSNSKSCSELVTDSYKKSFFQNRDIAISTMRAGNVIGGGDYAADRIIPDCVRAADRGKSIIIRNPYSTRPFQHVLEPVTAYLMVAAGQYMDKELAGSYNVGPNEKDCITAGELAELFCELWEKQTDNKVEWLSQHDGGPHEAGYLKLDCSKLKKRFGWQPKWDIRTVVEKSIKGYICPNQELNGCILEQIKEYLGT